MSTVKNLRESQMRIATNARAKFNEITDDTPAERAAEINREFDAMMTEHDAIGARIERAKKIEAVERSLNSSVARVPHGEDVRGGGQDDGEAITYRAAFHAMIRSGGMVSDMSPEERAVLKAGYVAADPAKRAQTAGTNSAGGYTVPIELANFIDIAMKAWGPMADENICTVINTTSGNEIQIPTIDDTSKSGAAHTEGTALTDDGSEDVTFGQGKLNAYSFDTEFIKWSMELSMDSFFNVESLLGDLLGQRLGRLCNTQLTTGSGSSTVKGIVTASSLGKTAAAIAAITGDEIIDLLHSVDPAYRQSPKARFMFNDTVLGAVRKLKDGQGNYLWQMGDVTKGVPGTLLGHQYSINQAMASLGTGNKVMLFGDFSKFYVRKVGQPVIGVMRERFWPDLGIAGIVRIDGEIGQSGAIKHLINA